MRHLDLNKILGAFSLNPQKQIKTQNLYISNVGNTFSSRLPRKLNSFESEAHYFQITSDYNSIRHILASHKSGKRGRFKVSGVGCLTTAQKSSPHTLAEEHCYGHGKEGRTFWHVEGRFFVFRNLCMLKTLGKFRESVRN